MKSSGKKKKAKTARARRPEAVRKNIIKGGKTMNKQAIGMLETRGLVTLVQATDAMLKSANVQLQGWQKVGSGFCSCFITGDVAAVKAALDAGNAAAKEVGEVLASQILPMPHEGLSALMPK
jgi:ethanolamine utilization protein EutM